MTSRSDPSQPDDPSAHREVGPGRRAQVVGLGLIGGSLGKGLRQRGWHVSGSDLSAERSDRALAMGVIDKVGDDLDAELVFVATPSSSAGGIATDLLSDKERRADLV